MFLGTVCTESVLWLFLTEMDGVCVFVLELSMRDAHREKKEAMGRKQWGCFHGRPSAILGSPVWLWGPFAKVQH